MKGKKEESDAIKVDLSDKAKRRGKVKNQGAAKAEEKNTGAHAGEEPADQNAKEEKKDWEAMYRETYEKYLRLHAEFDNFKKRMTKDKAEAIRFANQGLIEEILPFVDNLERSLQHADESGNFNALKDGILMTLDQLLKALEKAGLEPIKAEGEPFDPEIHEAIMQVEAEEVASNHVVEEFQKGYKLHGRVIRPATVTVSK